MSKMTTTTRIIVALASLLMILAYFFPLWDISLEAPQYPEGLGLQIWINRIDGQVDIINGLNHYIGMKYITPETFPELIYMPYIVGGLIALGLLTALVGKRILLIIFAVILILSGIAGAYDYYRWAYDYGHNLNPTAAIKVPGMSYQPPMLGSKELLNFTATAWPGIGGLAVIIAAFVVLVVTIYEIYRRRKMKAENSNIYTNA